MNKAGTIVIIEDDLDDQYLLELIFKELDYPNQTIYFLDGQKALDYLEKTNDAPFLILSDINMPKLDGFALREKLHNDAQLRLKCIPYLFFSTAVSQKAVINAYSLSVQGFFIKPNTIEDLKATIKTIVDYWNLCASPNSF